MPQNWTDDEIVNDAARSKAKFVERRRAEVNEPSLYLGEYEEAMRATKKLIRKLPDLVTVPVDKEELGKVIASEEEFAALRYLAGPPVSEDDLVTLIGSPVNGRAVKRDQVLADKVASFFLLALDSKRFPWIAEGRAAKPIELRLAAASTTVAIASQRTQTRRRSLERAAIEGAVAKSLRKCGYVNKGRPKPDDVSYLSGLQPGEFLTNCNIGDHNGDFIIRLRDGRTLAVECKASNSELNSRKRVAKESERDADHWTKTLGGQVITAVALRGVFSPDLIKRTQETGMLIFWEHKLKDFEQFVESSSTIAPRKKLRAKAVAS